MSTFVDLTDEQRHYLERAHAWLLAGGDNQYKFDMEKWHHTSPAGASCGTMCCIGGYIEAERAKDRGVSALLSDDSEWDSLDHLFYPGDDDDDDIFCSTVKTNTAWAARCVRKLLDEGVIDWPGTRTPA